MDQERREHYLNWLRSVFNTPDVILQEVTVFHRWGEFKTNSLIVSTPEAVGFNSADHAFTEEYDGPNVAAKSIAMQLGRPEPPLYTPPRSPEIKPPYPMLERLWTGAYGHNPKDFPEKKVGDKVEVPNTSYEVKAPDGTNMIVVLVQGTYELTKTYRGFSSWLSWVPKPSGK